MIKFQHFSIISDINKTRIYVMYNLSIITYHNIRVYYYLLKEISYMAGIKPYLHINTY